MSFEEHKYMEANNVGGFYSNREMVSIKQYLQALSHMEVDHDALNLAYQEMLGYWRNNGINDEMDRR